jgi:hypothetical protein
MFPPEGPIGTYRCNVRTFETLHEMFLISGHQPLSDFI